MSCPSKVSEAERLAAIDVEGDILDRVHGAPGARTHGLADGEMLGEIAHGHEGRVSSLCGVAHAASV